MKTIFFLKISHPGKFIIHIGCSIHSSLFPFLWQCSGGRAYAILVEYFRDCPRRHNCPISSLVHKTSLLLPLRCIVHSRYFTSQFMCFYARVKFTAGHRMFTFLCSSVSVEMFLMWLILKKSRTGIFMFIRRLYSRYWCRRFSSQLLLSQI